MNDEDIIVGLDMLTDMELIDLYNDVLEHIRFLDKSVIEEDESEGKNNE